MKKLLSFVAVSSLMASSLALADISLQYKTTKEAVGKWIAPKIKLQNDSDQALSLENIVVEYYYYGGWEYEWSWSDYITDIWHVTGGDEDAASLNITNFGFSSPYGRGGNFKVTTSFDSSQSIPANGEFMFAYGIRKVDGDDIDSTGDYSFIESSEWIENQKIVVRNVETGETLWGTTQYYYPAQFNTVFTEAPAGYNERLDAEKIIPANDGGYFAIYTLSGSDEVSWSDPYFMKLGPQGQFEWAKYFVSSNGVFTDTTYTWASTFYREAFEEFPAQSGIQYQSFSLEDGSYLGGGKIPVETDPQVASRSIVAVGENVLLSNYNALRLLSSTGELLSTTPFPYQLENMLLLRNGNIAARAEINGVDNLVIIDLDGNELVRAPQDVKFNEIYQGTYNQLILNTRESSEAYTLRFVDENGNLVKETRAEIEQAGTKSYRPTRDEILVLSEEGVLSRYNLNGELQSREDNPFIYESNEQLELNTPLKGEVTMIYPAKDGDLLIGGRAASADHDPGERFPWFGKIGTSYGSNMVSN